MTQNDTIVGFRLATCALFVVTAIPSLVLFCCSLKLVRRHKDPARRWTLWFKLALGFLTIGTLFEFIAYTLEVISLKTQASWNYYIYDNMFAGTVGIHIVAMLIDNSATIFALLALSHVNKSISSVARSTTIPADHIDQPSTTTLRSATYLQVASYLGATILSILNITNFGICIYTYAIQFNSIMNYKYTVGYEGQSNDGNPVPTIRSASAAKVWLAFLIVLLIFGTAIMVGSILTRIQVRSEQRLKKTCYTIASYSLYTDNFNPFPQVIHTTNTSLFKTIGDVIFGIWPMFVLLCVLFALGVRKQNGLWSTDQLVKDHRRDGSGTSVYDSPDTNRGQPWRRDESHQGSDCSTEQSYTLRVLNSDSGLNGVQRQEMSSASPSPQEPRRLYPPHEMEQPPEPQELPTVENRVCLQCHSPTPTYNTYDAFSFTSTPPPLHADAMGLNHQADGTPPQGTPRPYNEKSSF